MTNGQNVARARHLEDVANGAKRYILAEILDVTQAVASELENLGGATDFTGATSSTGGLSGLVPAPSIGDQNKFLRGDGTWATVSGGGSNVVSGGNVSVLDTVASTVDGSLWYEMLDGVPVLKLRKGNYEYNFNYDTLTYHGGNSNLVAHLPFDSSTTADACGNTWTAVGNVSISSAQSKFGSPSLYLDGSSYLVMDNGLTLGGQDFTIDCWVYIISSSYGRIFEISVNETSGAGTTSCIVEYPDGTHFNTSLSGSGGSASGFSSRNAWHHCALVYSHAAQSTYGFIDGQLLGTKSGEFSRALFRQIFISQSNYFNSSGYVNGYYSHFRIFDGVALWTSDFTPPTAADYS